MVSLPGRFDHAAWTTAIGTGIGYAIVIGLLFVALFVVPYLLFAFVL